MSDDAEILFANEAFYHLFRIRDMDGMDDLWARHAPVSCIHPGWQALVERHAIMQSWRGILSNPEAPAILCRGSTVQILGGLGIVLCYEIVGGSVLVATNLFIQEGGAWKLIHHQAGPCSTLPENLADETPPAAMQ